MNRNIKILVTGDTHLGGGRLKKLALDKQTKKMFGEYLDDIRNSDLSITNLESPLIDDGVPILKTGPNLKSPIKSIEVLSDAGFNLVTLANNHVMDYGPQGLNSTIYNCNRHGIKTVGAGENLDKAREIFYKSIKGTRIAVINIAENEFGTTSGSRPGAHPLNPVSNFYVIQKAKRNSDFVILIVHGGHEYYPLPSPKMQETYRFFIDSGADIVIGHHPHCYSGFEIYREAPIFYSLGNFLFDKNGNEKNEDWNIGIFLMLTILNSKISFEVKPYIQNCDIAGLCTLNKKELSVFNENIKFLNTVILSKSELDKNFKNYCKKKKNLYMSYIEPHSINVLHALRNRNLFPSLLKENKKRLLLNLTRCEAHRDVLINLLDYENSNPS